MPSPLIIETPRLLLREFSQEDVEGMFEMSQDPEIYRFTGDGPFATMEEAKAFIEAYSPYAKYGFGRWTVRLKANNEYLGWCGLKYLPELDEYDLGYRLLKQHRGNGYATEAGKACLDAGFTTFGLKKIVGRAVKENANSINVLKKLGMVYEKDFTDDGDECVQYYITPDMFYNS